MKGHYEVITITELSRVGDLQNLEKYYRHRIRTAGGVVISVDIDEADFTAEKAAPILKAAAENADKIKQSGG